MLGLRRRSRPIAAAVFMHSVGRLSQRELLLDLRHAVETEQVNDYSGTRNALHTACDRQEVSIAELLLQNGAHVNAPDLSTGMAPLHFACDTVNMRMLDLILQYHPEIDYQDNRGFTALHVAAKRGRPATPLVASLLAAGANAHLLSRVTARTPLHYAALTGAVEMARLLITTSEADVNVRDVFGYTPLHYAAEGGHVITVETLLQLGGDAGIVDEMRHTPAELAASRGHMDAAMICTSARRSWLLRLLALVRQGRVERRPESATPWPAGYDAGELIIRLAQLSPDCIRHIVSYL